MRSAVFSGDSRVEVREVPDPRPGTGEVLLRIHASALCGSELKHYRSGQGRALNAGHEIAAEVIEANAAGIHQPGDHVVVNIMAAHTCGRCYFCLSGDPKYCKQAQNVWGAHCELIAADARACLPLPADIAFETGALLGGDFVGTSYRAVKRLGVGGLDTVMVIGAGPVGLGVLGILRFMGARVIVVEPTRYRRDLAAAVGATVLDPNDVDVQATAVELTSGLGPHVVIDCAGRPETQNLALDTVRIKGKVGFVGENQQLTINPSKQIIHKELTIVGSVYYTPEDYQEILLLYRQGYRPEQFVTHRFPLAEADQAFRTFASGESGKVLLTYGP